MDRSRAGHSEIHRFLGSCQLFFLRARADPFPLFLPFCFAIKAKAYVLHPFPYISLADAEEDQRRTIEYLSHSGMSRVREVSLIFFRQLVLVFFAFRVAVELTY